MKGCSVDGCSRNFYARGWCKLHYMQWYAPRWRDRTTAKVTVRTRSELTAALEQPEVFHIPSDAVL
jgi:hypothetical protein